MFVVFDIETTGLYEMSHDVIQFSYILFNHSNQYVRAETLYFYYEGMSWTEEAYAVHKIPLDFLKEHAGEFRENLIKMYSILSLANVAGHNALRFDCPFVKTWLLRMGLKDLKFGITLDTMVSFRPVTHRSRIKLTALTSMLDITPDDVNFMKSLWFPNSEESGPHDAEYDTTATALIVLEGIRRNLMVFDRSALLQVSSEVDAISVESSISTQSKIVDPNYFVVFTEDKGSIDAYTVNHDKDKYSAFVYVPSNLDGLIQMNRVLPVVLKAVSSNTYEAEAYGTKYTLLMDETGDTLTISNDFITMRDTEMGDNFFNVIKNNFKEEDIKCLKNVIA